MQLETGRSAGGPKTANQQRARMLVIRISFIVYSKQAFVAEDVEGRSINWNMPTLIGLRYRGPFFSPVLPSAPGTH